MFTEQDKKNYFDAVSELVDESTSHDLADLFIKAGVERHNVTPQSVAARIRSCCNINRSGYFFKVSELVLITRHTGSLAFVSYINKACGCLPPQIDPNADVTLPKLPVSASALKRHKESLVSELEVVENRLSQLANHPNVQPTERVVFSQEAQEG